MSGTGPRAHHFQSGDNFTELYKNEPFVAETRKKIIADIKKGKTIGNNQYSLSGIQGLGKYLKDASTLLTGGLTGNLATTYLGSHSLTYKVISIDETNGIAVVEFIAKNASTIQSALRPPIVGYSSVWQNTVGRTLNNIFSSGPLSKTEQTIRWTETVKYR